MLQMFLDLAPYFRPRLALPLALCVLGGCVDGPTYPAAMQWLADDEEWVAVLPPEMLPAASAWARASAVHGDTALVVRVSALEAAAVTSLWRGDVGGAAATRAEIVSLVAGSLPGAGTPDLMRDASSAIQTWLQRVDDGVALEDGTPVAAAMDSVALLRDRAVLALSEGDSVAAAAAFIDAGERIRTWSPTVVAVRVLGRAEARVADLPAGSPDGVRARHLIRSSNDAIRSGEPLLALQRALYALQVASGRRLDPVSAAPDPTEPPT